MYYNEEIIKDGNDAILCCVDYINIEDNQPLKYADIFFAVKDKLTDLIEEYIVNSNESGQNAYANLSLLFEDYLQVQPNTYSLEVAVENIMDCPQMASYLDSKKVEINIISQKSLIPTYLLNRIDYKKSEFVSNMSNNLDCGLEGFLQVLSQINK